MKKFSLLATSLLAAVTLTSPVFAQDNVGATNTANATSVQENAQKNLPMTYRVFYLEYSDGPNTLDMETAPMELGKTYTFKPKEFPGFKLKKVTVSWGWFYEETLTLENATFSRLSDDALKNALAYNPYFQKVDAAVFYVYEKIDTPTPPAEETKTFTLEMVLPDGSKKSEQIALKKGATFDAAALAGYNASKHDIKEGKPTYTYDEVSAGQVVKIVLANKQVQTPPEAPIVKTMEVRRFYHGGLRVHLYSNNPEEISRLRKNGWRDEGVAFNATTSDSNGQAVYRLYNPHVRRHLWTKNENEYRILATVGWKQEGIAFRSSGSIPVYRLYHSGIGRYLYTKNTNEYSVLAGRGWRQEGIAWYVEK